MNLKVLLLHQSCGDHVESLASIGSFASERIPLVCKQYIVELAEGAEFDIYLAKSCPVGSTFFTVVSFDHVDIDSQTAVQVKSGSPSPEQLKDILLSRKVDKMKNKPSSQDPHVPEWINNALNSCCQLPDTEDMSLSDIVVDEGLLEAAKSTDYSAISYTYQQLCCLVFSMLISLSSSLRIDKERLQRFIMFIYANYRENSYHNFRHAVDVMQSVWCFTQLSSKELQLTDLEHFTLLITALAHDVGHFGFKNKFIIESEHPLALLYNDRSPVENYHCLLLFSIIRRPECHFGPSWDGTMRREFRRISTSLILATDMIYHFEYVKKFQSCFKCQLSSTCCAHRPALSDIPDQRLLNMIMLIKAADLCNVIRPYRVAEQWGTCLQTEFYHQVLIMYVLINVQGDWEKHLGIECPVYDDRTKDHFPSSQVSFYKNVALPLFSILAERFPALSVTKEALIRNIEQWESRM